MSTYKLIIQYKGTRYSGWQKQPDDITIQGELNKVLSKISKSEDVKTLGSGRTDSGVHALGQVVKASIPLDLKPEELQRGLNSLLPNDISVISTASVSDEFNPVRDATSKEYNYLFSVSKELSLFHRDYVSIAPRNLDIDTMKKACTFFEGTHDFADFQCVGTEVSSTVREIMKCELLEYRENWGIFPLCDDMFMLRVTGEGFLKQMVRLIVGSLWSIGQSKASLEQLSGSLNNPTGNKLGPVAPAQGLFLKEVFYP